MKKNSKKKDNQIFDSIRKPIAPKGSTFKTRKGENDRNKKHKGNIFDQFDKSE